MPKQGKRYWVGERGTRLLTLVGSFATHRRRTPNLKENGRAAGSAVRRGCTHPQWSPCSNAERLRHSHRVLPLVSTGPGRQPVSSHELGSARLSASPLFAEARADTRSRATFVLGGAYPHCRQRFQLRGLAMLALVSQSQGIEVVECRTEKAAP